MLRPGGEVFLGGREEAELFACAVAEPVYDECIDSPVTAVFEIATEACLKRWIEPRSPLQVVDLGPGTCNRTASLLLRVAAHTSEACYHSVDINPWISEHSRVVASEFGLLTGTIACSSFHAFAHVPHRTSPHPSLGASIICLGSTAMNMTLAETWHLASSFGRSGDIVVFSGVEPMGEEGAGEPDLAPYLAVEHENFNRSAFQRKEVGNREGSAGGFWNYQPTLVASGVELGFDICERSGKIDRKRRHVTVVTYRYNCSQVKKFLRRGFRDFFIVSGANGAWAVAALI